MSNIRRMIEKECQRDSLVELCEYWDISVDDFDEYLDGADEAWKNRTDENQD